MSLMLLAIWKGCPSMLSGGRQMKAEAFEEHDGGINAGSPCSSHALPKSIKVGLVKGRKIKFGLGAWHPWPGQARYAARAVASYRSAHWLAQGGRETVPNARIE